MLYLSFGLVGIESTVHNPKSTQSTSSIKKRKGVSMVEIPYELVPKVCCLIAQHQLGEDDAPYL